MSSYPRDQNMNNLPKMNHRSQAGNLYATVLELLYTCDTFIHANREEIKKASHKNGMMYQTYLSAVETPGLVWADHEMIYGLQRDENGLVCGMDI